ncbi:MAG: hypothetical protein ACREFK_19415 [Stellaceae bacterium]
MNLEQVRALFAGENAARVKKLIDRLDEIDAQMQVLGKERSELDAEINKILGTIDIGGAPRPRRQSGERRQRHCKLCGSTEHIIARKKMPDGRQTCPTYPEGKPLAAE